MPSVRDTTILAAGTRSNSTFTAPSGIQDGDKLVIILSIGGPSGPTATPPSGFTALPNFPISYSRADPWTVRLYAWEKIASSESGSYATSHGSASTEGIMYAISDAGDANPAPTANFDNDSTGLQITALGLTTEVDGALIIGVYGTWNQVSPTTPPSGSTPTFTERKDSSVLYICDGVMTTAGATGDKVLTSSTQGGDDQLAWGASLIAIEPPGGDETAPTITDVDTDETVNDGQTSVAVTGTDMGADETARAFTLRQGAVSVPQTETGSGTATAAALTIGVLQTGADIKYGSATLRVTRDSDSAFGDLSVTVNPPTGEIYVDLTSVNSTSADRITATPDLEVGDQLHARGEGGGAAPTGLTLNADGTFEFSSGNTPADFEVRVWDVNDATWGAFAVQSVGGTVAIASTGALSFGSSADLNATGTLTATGALAFGSSADLDATGSLAATGAIAFGSSADLDATGSLASTGALAFGSSADLNAIGELSATGAVAWGSAADLTSGADNELLSTGALAFGSSADLSATGKLESTGAIAFSASASLTGPDALGSIGAIAFGSDAVLTGAGALRSAGAVSFSGSASLTAIGALTAAGAISWGSSAALANPDAISIIGASASVRSVDGMSATVRSIGKKASLN